MSLISYSTRICKKCETELPLTGVYFKRSSIHDIGRYRKICKQCELEDTIKRHRVGNNLVCMVCFEIKPPVEFSNTKTNEHRDGKDRRCRVCRSTESTAHRSMLVNSAERIIVERFLGARDRAKKKNLGFNLTKEYLKTLLELQNGKCALTGIELTFYLGKGRIPSNLSIDRIKSDRGYVVGNVHFVCSAVNQFKNELPMDEFISLCYKIIETHETKNN